MATYNGEKYLERQVDSILQNLKEDDELIISDDGSSDNTMNILLSYAEADSRVRILPFIGKLGVVKNFERAIKEARGEIIFLSDQDDVWLPEKMDTVLEVFHSSDSVTCVVHDLIIVNQYLEEIAPSFFEFRNCGSGVIRNLIKNSFIGSAMAFDARVVRLATPMPDMTPMHDQWIGLLCSCVGDVRFINSKLGLYRRHDANVSQMQHGSVFEMFVKRFRLVSQLISRLDEINSFDLTTSNLG